MKTITVIRYQSIPFPFFQGIKIQSYHKGIIKITLFILFISFYACSTKEEKKGNSEKFNGLNFLSFKEPNTGLGRAISLDDTLEIKVRISECGEFGYRTEKIIVYRDDSRVLKAHLAIARNDSVRCDGRKAIKMDTIKTLSPEDERLINLFIHRVVELSLNQENFLSDSIGKEPVEVLIFRDAGDFIEIRNSELFISYWNLDNLGNTWYGFLRKQIFGVTFH